jgi:hypothetical protein
MIPSVTQHFGQDFIFMHDRSPIHTARIVQQWIAARNPPMELLNWPAKGADFNIIENVWSYLAQRVDAMTVTNRDELWQRVLDQWNLLANHRQFWNDLGNSIPKRVEEVIANNGEWSSY